MPTVMEAIIHAMIDFRREMLDNLQLSIEYHTEQLEEIKQYAKYMMEEQEKRMKSESELKFKELRDEINRKFEQQHTSISHQMQERNIQSDAKFHVLQDTMYKIRKTLAEIRDELLPTSCDQVKSYSSGIFYISPFENIDHPFLVLCNFENNFNLGGGWTVFQRRINGSVDFYRNWTMYQYGFGDVKGEHWLGLEKLHLMTKRGRHELLVLLEDFEGHSIYALYDEFKIASEEEKYRLTVGNYSGNAGDSLKKHNGMKFTTFDNGNDVKNSAYCAKQYRGAWWFRECFDRYAYTIC
ncbi:tenascin-like protein [Anopheles sinensis]|uniref:Fibrinogen C-terminal domain-containing protein n=1 Tax=Anopheles sinensis TaxID=74873 RepID=A0A084WK14_ANOSI|nr:tenascin-like protein [Anopheles sinensis]